jgi:[ribosomal protein S5]-alanine N-acetyltransferase
MDTTHELTTARLRLRPLGAQDLDDIVRLFSDPEVTRYLGRGPTRTRDQLAAILRDVVAHWEQRGYGIWAVHEQETGAFVGRCGLRFLDDIGEVELLYTLQQAYWGRGYATEAARVSVRFAFERTHLNRLIALADPDHGRSRRVMEKLGMRLEKEAPFRSLPTVWYALTPLDFVARQQELAHG